MSVCPCCGNRLAQERGLLVCAEHGSFFAYGPHLLVRAAHASKAPKPALPWETANRTR